MHLLRQRRHPLSARDWSCRCVVAAVWAALCGCQAVMKPLDGASTDPAAGASTERAGFTQWGAVPLPGKAATEYVVDQELGQPVLRARADSSASMWRRRVQVPPAELDRVRFAWRVPALMDAADLSRPAAADAVVRVVFAFDGDHARLPWRDRLMFDMAEGLTGERPPYATLMYVWDTATAVGTVLPGARSDRIRKLVVESGPQGLARWLQYERDVRADYRRVFGEEPGALISIGVMTDSDNTASQTQAFYREVEVLGPQGQRY